MTICIFPKGRTFGRLAVGALLVASPLVLRFLWPRMRALIWPPKKYSTYPSALEEQRYWKAAKRHGLRLRSSDARYAGARPALAHVTDIPVVTSYAPALLPLYRQRCQKWSPKYHLSVRTLCKWHRMVFPGPWHPSAAEASRMRRAFGFEDQREIHRISRMLPDEKVFGREAKWRPRYREIWRKWLARNDREMVIVFIEERC
ncbi:hypothetical protein FB45DRAFT_889267 [Roridomyces roridus]|uniref:Uncharacterized protein n=1 Tax=Roridomyces roridus TaxID=1738132 RepID=A0AAD7G308_9AGAR|nr:hypothetical protein FB45DRAFT_889267 [Roridomyces roridus]